MSNTKIKKELERRYGTLAEALVGYHDHIDFRFYDEFDDDAFAFLMKNVKGVNMLDLNETDITDESIKLLTNLEYIYELRAKQCRNLTNNCAVDLNKLTALTFLHLKSTEITVDGLLNLKNLKNLKTLLFSAQDVPSIRNELVKLKVMLLSSEIIINSKPYFFNTAELFLNAVETKPFLYKLKLKNDQSNAEWSKWIKQPVEHHVEAEMQGSYPIEDIDWVEIKPVENSPNAELSLAEDDGPSGKLIQLLDHLQFPFVINDGVFSIYILENEI